MPQLQALLMIAAIAPIPAPLVLAHRKSEAAKYPASVLWKIFDAHGISSKILPGIAVFGAMLSLVGIFFSCLTFALDGFLGLFGTANLDPFVATLWFTLPWLVGAFVLAGALIVWLDELVVCEPAKWVEFPVWGLANSLPPFAEKRRSALLEIDPNISFTVAELRQGKDVLDPILYAELDGTRLAIAVWDEYDTELILS